MKTFTMIIEKDKKGIYTGSIVELPGCEAKAKDLDELRQNIRDAILIYVAFHHNYEVKEQEFIGLQRVKVPIKELDACISEEE